MGVLDWVRDDDPYIPTDRWEAERLLVGAELSVDSDEYGLAGFDERDRLDVGPIAYSCGATLARRSSGYFMKTVGDRLAWLLVCTDSEAFTTVRRRRDGGHPGSGTAVGSVER